MDRCIITEEIFVQKMQEKYPNEGYDFSNTHFTTKTVGKRVNKYASFVCPKHGKIEGEIHNLLRVGCGRCSIERGREKKRNDIAEMEAKLKEHFKVDKVSFIWHNDTTQNSRKTVDIFNDNVLLVSGCYHELMKRKTTKESVKRTNYGRTNDYIAEMIPYMEQAKVHFVNKPEILKGNTHFIYANEEGIESVTTFYNQKKSGFTFKINRTREQVVKEIEAHLLSSNFSALSDYTTYKTQNDSIKLKCNICGYEWTTSISAFINQKESKCMSCLGKILLPFSEFENRANQVHNHKYKYSEDGYHGTNGEVKIYCPEHGWFNQKGYTHLKGGGCPKCNGKYSGKYGKRTTEEWVEAANKVHNNKYNYSKVDIEHPNEEGKICIICPDHGEFWQNPQYHLQGRGCPNCCWLRPEYKFNLLEEFVDEHKLREWLTVVDVNIIHIILRNLEKQEPQFSPIIKDINKLVDRNSSDPIKDLEDKYRGEEEAEEGQNKARTEVSTEVTVENVDLDDDEAVESVIEAIEGGKKEETKEPSIEDITKANEVALHIVTEIEHMLTPEDKQYLKDKFLNDKRREWMKNRDII